MADEQKLTLEPVAKSDSWYDWGVKTLQSGLDTITPSVGTQVMMGASMIPGSKGMPGRPPPNWQLQQKQFANTDTPSAQPKLTLEPVQEKVTQAAIKAADGKTYTGTNHGDAWLNMDEAMHGEATHQGITEGFMTSAGRFVDRKEARTIADKMGLATTSKKYLISEDLPKKGPAR